MKIRTHRFLSLLMMFLLSGASGLLFGQSTGDCLVSTIGSIKIQGDTTGVPGCHVINLTNGRVAVSDPVGRFHFIRPNCTTDTLKFSRLGFRTEKMSVSEFNLLQGKVVRLSIDTTEIETVDVNLYPTLAQFKSEFLSTEVEDPNAPIQLSLPKISNQVGREAGITMTDPLTALYMKYSKREQEKREYARLLKEDKRKAEIAERYNPELISRITEMKDSLQILRFVQFCNLGDAFIENSSDYELVVAINRCYAAFKNEEALIPQRD